MSWQAFLQPEKSVIFLCSDHCKNKVYGRSYPMGGRIYPISHIYVYGVISMFIFSKPINKFN